MAGSAKITTGPATTKPQGQRKPIDDDLALLLEKMWEGKSLRAACLEMGLHTPSTCTWLKSDPKRDEHYAHARDGRSEFLAEDAVAMTRGALVVDLFGGSGSTLIACEQQGRRCRLMELDPKFADVIVTRWQDFTGRTATLQATGQTFAEVAQQRAQEAEHA